MMFEAMAFKFCSIYIKRQTSHIKQKTGYHKDSLFFLATSH